MGAGPDRRAEQVFATTGAELVGRLKTFPHEKLLQLQCYSPRDFEGAWNCRRVSSVWNARRGVWPVILYTDDAGQDFLIDGYEEVDAPTDIDPRSRRLIARVESSWFGR